MIYVLQVELNEKEIKTIRQRLSKQNSVFSQKRFLDSLYLPSSIIGRKEQAEQLLRHIESQRHDFVVPVISVFGRSGSGKSTVVRFVCQNIGDLACSCYVNLRKARTVFGCANQILAGLGSESLKSADGINKAVDTIGSQIEEILFSKQKKFFILVLDEYDVIFSDKRGKPSDFMYKLLTLEEDLREKDLWLCLITISNNALSEYELDDRVKSRMGSCDVFFPPYKKDEVIAILRDRAKKAFAKPVDVSVLEYCAKLGSDDHGDARRALDLLRVSGELGNGRKITKKDVENAQQRLQKDRIELIVTNASYHQKVLISAICVNIIYSEGGWTSTSSIYDKYGKILQKDTKSLSYRRVVDLLVELENMGLVTTRTTSRGRRGYGTEYRLKFSPQMVGPFVGKEWWEDVVAKKEEIDKLDTELAGLKTLMGPRKSRFGLPYSFMKKYNL